MEKWKKTWENERTCQYCYLLRPKSTNGRGMRSILAQGKKSHDRVSAFKIDENSKRKKQTRREASKMSKSQNWCRF